MNEITQLCLTISDGISASDKLLSLLLDGKEFTQENLNAKDIINKFRAERIGAGLWQTNRQLGVNKTEKPADARKVRAWAESQPPSQRRTEIVASALAEGALKVAISRHKERLAAPAKEAAAVEARDLRSHAKEHGIQPGDCPATTVWDMDPPYRYTFPVVHHTGTVDEAIKTILASVTGRESKSELLATIEALKAMVV